jgi:alcohol dehydrogenase class IV
MLKELAETRSDEARLKLRGPYVPYALEPALACVVFELGDMGRAHALHLKAKDLKAQACVYLRASKRCNERYEEINTELGNPSLQGQATEKWKQAYNENRELSTNLSYARACLDAQYKEARYEALATRSVQARLS